MRPCDAQAAAKAKAKREAEERVAREAASAADPSGSGTSSARSTGAAPRKPRQRSFSVSAANPLSLRNFAARRASTGGGAGTSTSNGGGSGSLGNGGGGGASVGANAANGRGGLRGGRPRGGRRKLGSINEAATPQLHGRQPQEQQGPVTTQARMGAPLVVTVQVTTLWGA